MNAFLRKEARLLLPFWGIAMVLAIVPSFAVPAERYTEGVREIIYWTFAFGMILLGMAPFGHEFSLGTFSFLLAQPAQRNRIWRAKTLLVAIAALLVFTAFAASVCVRIHGEFQEYWRTDWGRLVERAIAMHQMTPLEAEQTHWALDHYCEAIGIGALLLAVGISGGFWSTLLFRQTGAALWFAILIPGLLIVVVQGISHVIFGGEPPNIIWVAVLILYSVAGVAWARRMFANAQDSQWLGETVALFSLSSGRAQADDAAVPRRKGAIRALVRKELASHQISFLIAFGLLVLHIITLVFRRFYSMPRNSEFRLALEAVPLLWLLIPWLMGCVAIAEERKLGTMEGQLCLPVNRRLQFVIKFFVVLVFGTLLGGLMPYLVECVGQLAGVFTQIVNDPYRPGGTSYFATLYELLIGAGLIGLVSLFASSLTRNTLHALGAAIVFAVGWLALGTLLALQFNGYALWRGPLIIVIGIPVAILTTIPLTFSNYKTLHAGSRVWLRTFAILFVTLFCTGIATAVIYQRPWELFRSVEPQPGAPQLSGPVQPVLQTAANRLFALLPDGRIWAAMDYQKIKLGEENNTWDAQQQKYVTTDVNLSAPASGLFVAGSNWVEIAASDALADVVALESDGTLWDLFSPESRTYRLHWNVWPSLRPHPHRIGSDYWKTVVVANWAFYGIKTNGTLWKWEFYLDDSAGSTNSGYHVTEPVQIGASSDWSRFFTESSGVLVMKTNGDLWGWREAGHSNWQFVRVPGNGSNWQSIVGRPYDDLVIHLDGTLWSRSWSRGRRVFGTVIPASPDALESRVGYDSDWLQISGDYPDVFALKKDGRLVKNSTELFSSWLGRPSQRSDWIALNIPQIDWNQRIALAADGTLCSWVDSRIWGGANGVLLAPTRRPAWILNILTDSKN
jgi:hypothetical protein